MFIWYRHKADEQSKLDLVKITKASAFPQTAYSAQTGQ
jgi:hypothetical protein